MQLRAGQGGGKVRQHQEMRGCRLGLGTQDSLRKQTAQEVWNSCSRKWGATRQVRLSLS